MKVAINGCYGGFALSVEAVKLGRELSGDPKWNSPCLNGDTYEWYGGTKVYNSVMSDNYCACNVDRTDETLIQVIEKLGNKASSNLSALYVVEIPDDVDWEISEYDGIESIEETHRSWS